MLNIYGFIRNNLFSLLIYGNFANRLPAWVNCILKCSVRQYDTSCFWWEKLAGFYENKLVLYVAERNYNYKHFN